MPQKEKYIAEGFSFEVRCEAAKNALLTFWVTMDQMMEDDLKHVQKKKEKSEKQAAEMSEIAQKLLAEWYERDVKMISNSSQELLTIAWDGTLSISRKVYGSDAVDFALEALKRQRKGN